MEKMRMKFISWNVNGLRACVQKGFLDYFHEADADIFCIQESKLQGGQIDARATRAIFSTGITPPKRATPARPFLPKQEPLACTLWHWRGRSTIRKAVSSRLEYDTFLFCDGLYAEFTERARPTGLTGWRWEEAFLAWLKGTGAGQSRSYFCGDLNVAHQEIDLKNPKTNRKNAGFTDEERA